MCAGRGGAGCSVSHNLALLPFARRGGGEELAAEKYLGIVLCRKISTSWLLLNSRVNGLCRDRQVRIQTDGSGLGVKDVLQGYRTVPV